MNDASIREADKRKHIKIVSSNYRLLVSVQNREKIWYTIKNLLQMERGVFLDNHKKYVLWIIDIAKLLAVVCGATLLGILFVKSGFPETNIVVIYIFAVLLVARFTKGYFYGTLSYSGSQ